MVWARISTLGCISRHLDEDVLHALAREVVLEHRVDLWRRWHTRPEHAPALRDLAGSSATMQSAHPCARKRPASAGGSTSPPPPLRLSATSSPPLPPPPPPPRLPARIAALSRALSVATKTGELPAEARHRITLTAPSTVMRRSVVGTVPGRKAVPAAPSPGRGRGGVDAGRDGPSSRPGLGDECPASNSQPRPHLSAASPGRISRPHLSATSGSSRTEAEVDALEGRVTKELPPPRLHRRREPGRRSEERAQQAAEGRGCGAALPGREDGPRRRPAAGRAGRAIASLFGGEGGVEPDCAHPRSVANHAHPPGGGHRVGAHRPAGREEEPPIAQPAAPPPSSAALSGAPRACVSPPGVGAGVASRASLETHPPHRWTFSPSSAAA